MTISELLASFDPRIPCPEFGAWVQAQPAKTWKNYDLSAVRLGYELFRLLHTRSQP